MPFRRAQGQLQQLYHLKLSDVPTPTRKPPMQPLLLPVVQCPYAADQNFVHHPARKDEASLLYNTAGCAVQAAAAMGVGRTFFKKLCRSKGIITWCAHPHPVYVAIIDRHQW